RHANSMAPGADTLRRVLPRCSIFLLSPLLRTLFDVLTATLGGILAVLVAALFPSRVTHLFHGVVPSILPSVVPAFFRGLVLVCPLLPCLVLLFARGD